MMTDDDGQARHDGRVDQGRGDRGPGLDVPLDVIRQLVKDLIEGAGEFRGLEYGDVVARKRLGVGCRGVGKGLSLSQLHDHVDEDSAQELVFRLLRQRLEGFHDGNTSFDEDTELAREVHDLLALDGLLGDLELKNTPVLLDLGRLDPALEEGQVRGTDGSRGLGTLDGLPVLVGGDVFVGQHGVHR